jgi:hypothetical protein
MNFRVFKLSIERFLHPHTSSNVASMLLNILATLKFDDRKFQLATDAGANVRAITQHLDNCLRSFKCSTHSFHTLLIHDCLRLDEKKPLEKVMSKDLMRYLEEGEKSLIAETEADESIGIGFEEIQNARLEQELLAEAGQFEKFCMQFEWKLLT